MPRKATPKTADHIACIEDGAPTPHAGHVRRKSMTIAQAQEWTGLSRSAIYRAIAAKHLQAVKHGRQTLVLGDSLQRYIDNLPAATIGATA